MLSDWYKKERARKAAPKLLIWTAGAPVVGVICVLAARWAIASANDFLSADQSNFMVATLLMIAVPAFVFSGYSALKLSRLIADSKLSFLSIFSRTDDER
ncbi:MAG TPA: hypothetical protein VFN49_07670 [Candidatus Aquilonibacter sp.]|nr:hypothetical protein [Candidatus Aquilonibacter sp.]